MVVLDILFCSRIIVRDHFFLGCGDGSKTGALNGDNASASYLVPGWGSFSSVLTLLALFANVIDFSIDVRQVDLIMLRFGSTFPKMNLGTLIGLSGIIAQGDHGDNTGFRPQEDASR